jgi:hypothetical protein
VSARVLSHIPLKSVEIRAAQVEAAD